jgi:SpoVK/Ycf46/Vps4 family AAA+-type ATPase
MKRPNTTTSDFSIVLAWARSAEGREKYPKLYKALYDIGELVGMTHVKNQIGVSIQEILAYAKLDEPPRAPVVTRGFKRRKVAEEEHKNDVCDSEEEDEGESENVEARVQSEVGRILLSLVAAGHALEDDSDDEDWIADDEEEEEEPPKIPAALVGTKRHALIIGPSGCGKTTLAQRLSRVWAAVGLVNSRFSAVSRGDIVSKWQGESVQKMKQLIAKHAHGVLFIDEAYSLVSSDRDVRP